MSSIAFAVPGSGSVRAKPEAEQFLQGIGKDVPRSQRTPSWEIPKKNISLHFVGIYG